MKKTFGNKFHARKVRTEDGQVFDSRSEYERWLELQDLERQGVIEGLQRQVRYELIPKQPEFGERAAVYTADFVYSKDGKRYAEDAKSKMTRQLPDYVLRRKMFRLRYGRDITFVEWERRK